LTNQCEDGTLLPPGMLREFRSNAMHSRKLEELIVYLGSQPGVTNLGPTKLWKLIYFVDSQALRELGESVTGSEFIKYEHGPVPSRGDKHLRQMTKRGELTTSPRVIGGMTLNELKTTRTPDREIFSKEELGIIEGVCSRYGRTSAKELSDLSHQEPSWHYADMREKLSPELMLYGASEDAEGL
jgi:uncharacterized phage-associated protein